MYRFRLLFVAIAVLVAVPVGLLLRRAIASVDLERRTRHQAVAERIFDEMERALSEMLVAEEARPFGQYSYEYVPPGQEGEPPARSPLAAAPGLPFVVGYFQIEPDGTLHTPLRPAHDDEHPLATPLRESVRELEQIVAPHFYGGESVGLARRRVAPVTQAPGTTIAASREADLGAVRERQQSKDAVSAYDALRALNKGVEQRAGRRAKTEFAAAPPEAPSAQAAASLAGAAPRAEAKAAATRSDVPQPPAVNEPARLEIAPMVGRALDPRHLLLYRTVVRAAQTYRQGLLLDLDKLAAWLRMQALGPAAGVGSAGPLPGGSPHGVVSDKLPDGSDIAAYASIAFVDPHVPAPPAAGGAPFVYLHRFAEPFADVSARLALQPLPGVGGARYVYALCAAVVVAGGLGLVALYLMVSVTVAYAERRSNFAAAVSHELKTPLTAIRMYGEMLRDGIVPVEAKRTEYYRHITMESERLSRLINNVLEFSRLEKGTRQMALLTESPGAVVEEAGALLRAHAERQGFTLDVEVAPSLPAVRFERDGLLQILFNLVDNAVKYARDAEPRRIRLACRRAGDAVHVSVRDHGPGVAPRHLRKVFQPFYRGAPELTRRTDGSGLGLALVRSLAAQMGARAEARNLSEGGFEVAVVFPAARV
jgi:signal transduction histidine kinase